MRLAKLMIGWLFVCVITACGGGGGGSASTPIPAATYTVGGTITGLSSGSLVLNNNGGDSITVASNGSFTFNTPLNSGDNYVVNISSQTSPSTCNTLNTSGSISSANVNSIQINCFNQYLYIGTNDFTNSLFGYKIDGSTGSIIATSTPAYNVPRTTSIAQSPISNFLFASNTGGIESFSIDPSSGNLTSVGSSENTASKAIAITPNGQFAFSSLWSSYVSGYSIAANTGSMTSVSGSPYTAGLGMYGVQIDASGKFVFSIRPGSPSTVYGYAINQNSGSLTTISGSPFTVGNGGYRLAANPVYQYLYVMNQSDATISGYQIDPTTGVITAVSGSPFPAGTGVFGGAFTPDGKFFYVTNRSDNTVSAFSVNKDTGALVALSGSPYPASNAIFEIAVDASGKYVYSVGGAIDIYSINQSSGVLTAISGSPIASPSGYISTVATTKH